jgi:uncharacterized SAM-binding protein YcdF (DUF218 family)
MAERNRLGSFARNVLLLTDITLGAIAGAIAEPLIVHPQEAQNAIAAFQGELDCGNGVTPETADAIFVPGAGMTQDDNGVFAPDYYQKIRLEAAAILYSQSDPNDRPYVVLLDGQPDQEDPLHGQSVVDYLQTEVEERTSDHKKIPSDHIVIDDTSINTASNMTAAKDIADELGIEDGIMATNDSHMDRSLLFACNKRLRVTGYRAESVIEATDGRNIYRDDGRWPLEQAEIALAYIDHEGGIPTLLKAGLLYMDAQKNTPTLASLEN